MKILIVDDSRAMRMIVRRDMRQAGFGDHTYIEATNGKEGLEQVRQAAPDLVLSDWNMPEMNGIEFLQAIKEESLSPKFGFVTSESTDEMREKAFSAGALFMICKPFTADVFQKELGGLIR